MPTSDHWMLTYETLDAVMKNTKNPDYYAMPSQANQQVLRKVLKDWKSHFELLASYRQNPGKFKAQPKQPGYIRTPYTTVTFTNQVAKRSDIKGKFTSYSFEKFITDSFTYPIVKFIYFCSFRFFLNTFRFIYYFITCPLYFRIQIV